MDESDVEPINRSISTETNSLQIKAVSEDSKQNHLADFSKLYD
jgi:hypothetical protein